MSSATSPKILVWPGFWTRDDVQANPSYLFVFGDNDVGRGRKGQAIIRGFPNAIGVPTKKFPTFKDSAYYSDEEYEQNCQKIQRAFDAIRAKVPKFEKLVLPENGLGTGLSDLGRRAPKTLEYLNQQIEKLYDD